MSSSPRTRALEYREASLRLHSMLPLKTFFQWSCALLFGLTVSCGIHTRLGNNAHAKIYTYERDGVVVISSEPPPKFHRPKRVRRSTKGRREVQSKSRRDTSSRSVEVKVPPKKKRKRNSRTSSTKGKRRVSWRPHRSIARYRELLKRAALRYQLPPRLLWSVLSSCHQLRRKRSILSTLSDPHFKTLKTEVACLSADVSRLLTVETSPLATQSRSKSTRVRRATQQIFDAAALLRRLINYYRGDVTLVLSAYPYAAYWSQHPVFSKAPRALGVDDLLNINAAQSASLAKRTTAPPHQDQVHFIYLTFSREAIALYHRLLEEAS